MDGVTARVYKGVKRYWRRRGYERLGGNTTATGRRKSRVESKDEAGGRRRRRFSWRIRIAPRLKLRYYSPKKFFIGLRDAYVRMMMRLANTSVVAGGGIGGYGGEGIAGFGVRPMKEYDEKMIIEIYKSLAMRQGQLVPLDASQIRSQLACYR